MKKASQNFATFSSCIQLNAVSCDQSAKAANDSFQDIEMRWGPGFAQWVLDHLYEEAKKR